MAAGRPSEYQPEFCDQVVEWGKLGKSKAWMASNLGVSRQTLDTWTKVHPEFLDAITTSQAHAQAWWEDLGQNNVISVTGQSLNSGVYTRSMAARFPDDWREKTATELTGKDGAPVFEGITVKFVKPDDNG